MAGLSLEQRVAALEREVAALKGKGAAHSDEKWWERLGGAFANDAVFAEMLEYGRYFRKTGQEPPPDWKPGDLIPEPDDGEGAP